MRLKLDATNDDFRALHGALHSVRESSATVTVSKAALTAVLKDHGALIREFSNEIGGSK